MKNINKKTIKIYITGGIFFTSIIFLCGWFLLGGRFSKFNKEGQIYNLDNNQTLLEAKSSAILKTPLDPKEKNDSSGDKILVKLKEGEKEKITEYGVPEEKIEKKDKLEIYEIDVSGQDFPKDLIDKLSSDSDVEYVEFDQTIRALVSPNDTYYSNQWALPKINAPSAWDQTIGSSTFTIAIIDSGVDGIHQDLTGKVLAGYDFVHNTSISANTNSDDLGHGTLCAGASAAVSNNSQGVAGVDWNVRIMPVKVLNSGGTGTYSDLIDGIMWATDNGADVISMSLGGYAPSNSLKDALEYAYNNGVASFGASGNNDLEAVIYPAAYNDYVTAVGATNQSDQRCTVSDWGYDYYGNTQGSNYGVELDVMAPGNHILSTYWMQSNPNNAYAYTGGTSLACPHVSGLACLLMAQNGSLQGDPGRIREIIAGTSDKVSEMGGKERTNYHGYGRINANSAINNASDGTPSSQQKISLIKNDYQKFGFYMYQGPVGTQACTRTDSNFWDIPSDNEIVSMAYLDGDKIGVIKRSGGDENFYLYEAPAGPDSCQLLGSDLWNIPSGNNIVSICGINLIGSGADKIAVLKNESYDHNFYIYNAPVGSQACTMIASDFWNIPSGSNVTSIAGVDYSGDGYKDKIAVMKNENGDFNLYVYNAPAAIGTPATLYGTDNWNIPSGNNVVDLGG